MSSLNSAGYSPISTYSYPSNISVSSSSPPRPSRPPTDSAIPPRLSSPHIFRDIFVNDSAGSPTRAPPILPPLHEVDYYETMQDVNRALQSANRALQTAQEAFQPRGIPSDQTNRHGEVVDLTLSPPSHPTRDIEAAFFENLEENLQADSRRTHERMMRNMFIGQRPSQELRPFHHEEDDPTSRYAGQSDSLAGPRRRFETQRSHITIPNMERTLISLGTDAQRREDEDAIRRQRVAREHWQRVQQRLQNREQERASQHLNRAATQRPDAAHRTQDQQRRREREEPRLQLRDRSSVRRHGNQSQGQQTRSQPPQETTSQSSTGLIAESGSQSRRPVSPASSARSSSVEAIDLTTVNDTTDLTAALLQSQSQNSTADPNKPSGIPPRSALTAYKCPICLEAPRNATSTVCGHLFCHECILETLKNSENMRREDAPPGRKIKGQCPVCRKELARKEDEGNGRTLIPLEIKLISKKQLEEQRRLERKRQREALQEQSQDKGKGKARLENSPTTTELDGQVFDLTSEDEEDDGGVNGSSQKENRAKRIKLTRSEELEQDLFGAFLHADELMGDEFGGGNGPG